MKKALLPMLLALALPASALADDTIGGDPYAGDPDHLIQCTDNGVAKPCTLIVDTIDGKTTSLPAGTITKFTGYFDIGSEVSVSVLRRSGSGFVVEAQSPTITTHGYTESFDVDLPVAAGRTIALNLYKGSVGGLADDDSRILATEAPLAKGQTGSGEAAGYGLNLSVDVAPPRVFSIDKQAVLSPDARGIEVFTSNELDKKIDGRIGVAGEKGTDSIWHYDYHSRDDFTAPIGRKLAQKILKKGRASVTVIAKTTGGTFTQKVTVLRGGAAGYDGTYRGTQGLVLVVKRGVITNVSQTLTTFCQQTGGTVMRTMQVGLGMPALIARNGSFDHHASYSADEFTYKGKLNRNGTAKGYNSLWYSTFDSDPVSGNIRPVQCFQASNWTATRAK